MVGKNKASRHARYHGAHAAWRACRGTTLRTGTKSSRKNISLGLCGATIKVEKGIPQAGYPAGAKPLVDSILVHKHYQIIVWLPPIQLPTVQLPLIIIQLPPIQLPPGQCLVQSVGVEMRAFCKFWQLVCPIRNATTQCLRQKCWLRDGVLVAKMAFRRLSILSLSFIHLVRCTALGSLHGDFFKLIKACLWISSLVNCH